MDEKEEMKTSDSDQLIDFNPDDMTDPTDVAERPVSSGPIDDMKPVGVDVSLSQKELITPKKHIKKTIAMVVLALVLIIVSAAGAYFYRDKVANDAIKQKNNKISSLTDENDNLASDIKQKDVSISTLKISNSTLIAQQKQNQASIATLESDNATLAERSAAQTANDDSWRNFSSTKLGFDIQFPGIPYEDNSQTLALNGDTQTMTVYSRYDNSGNAYMVGVATYPSDTLISMPSGNARLDMALEDSIGAYMPIDPTSSSYLQFNGCAAKKVIYAIPNDPSDPDSGVTNMFGLVFFKGNTLYALSAYGPQLADFNTFINSFSFTN